MECPVLQSMTATARSENGARNVKPLADLTPTLDEQYYSSKTSLEQMNRLTQ